jgi:ketosteroid isomerase-like protein
MGGMGDVDAFLAAVVPRMQEETLALINGYPLPRQALWSHQEPVTVFGALFTHRGWPEVCSAFDRLAASFSGGTSCDYDVLAAGVSGDLGYLVAIERTVMSGAEGPPERWAIRVTALFRHEEGAWRQVHRHGDPYDSDSQRLRAGMVDRRVPAVTGPEEEP